MLQPVVEFTEAETGLLQNLGIAIFRNKIILDAQGPVTDFQLAKVRKKIDGEIPPDLLSPWKTSFGGELDYNYEILFGDHLYAASLCELFYPGSDHYHDLDGWIDVEIGAFQEMAEERGIPKPDRIPVIPFGGFEYLERFYVSLEPEEYGAVVVYAQGIPWKGRLNEDSVAIAAGSVAELFDQLSLDEDPFDEESDEYAFGKSIVARIGELDADYPELARKLKILVLSSVFDWRSMIEKTDFTHELSARESKALRLALEYAVNRKDMTVIAQLHEKGAPFDQTLHGSGGILQYAMEKQAFDIVDRLLDLKVDVDSAPIIYTSGCTDVLLLKLIAYGVLFDEEAIYSAAATGALDGAIAVATSGQLVKPMTLNRIAAAASKRAAKEDENAVKVENGNLDSYLTANEYREQARALRDFAARLQDGA